MEPLTAAPARLRVFVYGTPAPQGSKRHVGNGVMVESSPKVRPWREDVKLAALRALELTPEWDRAARVVRLAVTFTLARPRAHYRTGRHADELREGAPALHGTKPDLDKLLRSTCDALGTAGVYVDDSRVAAAVACKLYVGSPGAPLSVPGAWIELTGESR